MGRLASKEFSAGHCQLLAMSVEAENWAPSMDASVWAKLNPELIERVLSKLPFHSLVRFRTVCKHWKALIESPSLAPAHTAPNSVFFHFRPGHVVNRRWVFQGRWVPQGLTVYNACRNSWVEHSLTFLENYLELTLVAAEGGLLCFSKAYQYDQFVICNPLTKQWKCVRLPKGGVLPALPRGAVYSDPYQYLLVGLIVDTDSGTYKLVVGGIHQAGPKTLIYDSCTGAWKRSAPVPRMQSLLRDGEWTCSERSVCCNGNLYWFLAESNASGCDEDNLVKGIVKFNPDSEVWSVAQESIISERPSYLHIAKHNQDVLLVDFHDEVFREQDGRPELLSLGPEMRLMQPAMLMMVRSVEGLDPYFQDVGGCDGHFGFGQGDYFYLGMSECTGGQGRRVLAYNTVKNAYAWLPVLKDCEHLRLCGAFAPALRAFP